MVAQQSISEKLASALPYHFKEAQSFRTSRAETLRDYAGRTTHPGYKDQHDEREKQIVNLTIQAAEAHTMNLAASRPRFLCTSRYTEHEAAALKFTRALDRYAEELYLEETLQEICRDSFVSLGIAKIYQASSAAVGIEADYRMDPGRPFMQRVSPDRFVWDTNATCESELSFVGDRYTIPYRQATKSPRFSGLMRAKIKEAGPEGGNRKDSDRGEDLARSQDSEPIDDFIYLVDVFIRERRAVWTYVCDKDLNLRIPDPVQRVRWKGDECGPYYFLNMGPIPDHFMPSSPAQNQKLLVELYNTLYRKLEDQARRQKIVTAGLPGSIDIEIMRDAKDGEYVELSDPQAVTQIRTDGPDQNLLGMLMNTGEAHSRSAGNLNQKLGLAQSADTATQEKMIGAMSSRMEAFYQQRYVSFVRKSARGLARLIFHDEHLAIPGTYTVPGTDYQVSDDWMPHGAEGAREGYFDYYRVDIDPYAMGYQSPAERIAIIDADLGLIAQFYPILVQMGTQLDLGEVFAERARLRGMPILGRMLKFNQPPFVPQGGGSEGMSSSDPNKGHYTHTSRSTSTPEGEALAMMQAPQQGAA